MIFKNFGALFTFTFFTFCDSSFVDNLSKCHLNDNECFRNLYPTVLKHIGKHGIPELNIPAVDPIKLKDVTVSVLNMVNITMVDGVAKGITDCIFEKLSLNVAEGRGHQENTCDLTIKGHYKVEAASRLLKQLFQENEIHGEGNGKVKIEKLHLTFDFPFYAQKRDDGEIYLKTLYDKIKYDYEIRGNVGFFADNLYAGEQEVSKLIIQLLNENSKFVFSTFGKPFIDKAMEFYFKFSGYFFDYVPARHFIIEDLTPYAKP